MDALFVELPMFEAARKHYLDDDEFRALQNEMMQQPDEGERIQGTGGLRKIRFGDRRRQKGKRGGIRVIYYYWMEGVQFWMFAIYDKDELDDLSPDERKRVAQMLKAEIEQRTK
jgi:hypothetical protein